MTFQGTRKTPIVLSLTNYAHESKIQFQIILQVKMSIILGVNRISIIMLNKIYYIIIMCKKSCPTTKVQIVKIYILCKFKKHMETPLS